MASSFFRSLHLLHGDHSPQPVQTGHPGSVHLETFIGALAGTQPVAGIRVPKITQISFLLCVPEPQVTLHALHGPGTQIGHPRVLH